MTSFDYFLIMTIVAPWVIFFVKIISKEEMLILLGIVVFASVGFLMVVIAEKFCFSNLETVALMSVFLWAIVLLPNKESKGNG